MSEWMQFMITKKKDRAHVFQQDPNNKLVLYSLCLRWQVRKVRNTRFPALEKAYHDRPRCRNCEKRLKEIGVESPP